MNSLTLIELLRRRSALPVEETRRLLDELPVLLDVAERQGDLPTARLLKAVEVVFASDTKEDCTDRSINEWRAFRLDLIADATQRETMATVDPPEDARFSHDPSARFAALLYELLGGPHRNDEARPPLPALGETANRTLQRALAGGGFASCAEFWREFLRESADTRRVVRIPPRLLSSGTRGEVMRLIPHDKSVPIRFIARSQFHIGRSVAEADLLTRLHPKTPENEHRTHQLGRVHVFGEIIEGQPTLRDGTGTSASENGSMFDGQPLAHDRPTPIWQRAALTLAGHYALEIIPHLSPTPDVVIENLAAWRCVCAGGTPEVRGAIVFARCDGEPMLRETVWLFTRVEFILGKNDQPIWLPPARNNPAAFLRLGGCFWLLNATANDGMLRLDNRSIAAGEAAPLATGQSLRLGAREYSVEVE